VVHLAVNGKYAGHIVISDEIKEDSLQAIQGLKEAGVRKLLSLEWTILPGLC